MNRDLLYPPPDSINLFFKRPFEYYDDILTYRDFDVVSIACFLLLVFYHTSFYSQTIFAKING